MGSLGRELSTQLYKDSTIVVEVSWTHSEVLKSFGSILFIYLFIFFSECFDKSLNMTSLENVHRQSPRYFLQKNVFYKAFANFTEKQLCRCLFFNKVESYSFYSIPVNSFF